MRQIFRRLSQVTSLDFLAYQNKRVLANAKGRVVTHHDGLKLDFVETIFVGQTPSFDVKRFELNDNLLYFYRKRAEVFELIAVFANENDQIISKISHWCSPDCYSSTLSHQDDTLMLHVIVKGRHKDEQIMWTYH
ncbi:MAG: DUF6314 family protein [Moraxella sp.]|uniref:DUF6314 family protein n=1 Tax=Moraxella sp. TaxID=479 RepID=UPI0026DB0CB8|nr:DUF6314 family protein [Moraxella sp.]MDO4450830.1 DUF6314 family protein [Moraxella sp.]